MIYEEFMIQNLNQDKQSLTAFVECFKPYSGEALTVYNSLYN